MRDRIASCSVVREYEAWGDNVVAVYGYDGSDIPSLLAFEGNFVIFDDPLAIVKEALKGRGPKEAVPRAFETLKIQAGVTIDYGAYRDLQRHRMCTPFPGVLGCKLGFDTPPLLALFGVEDEYVRAMRAAAMNWAIVAETAPMQAQYMVPLGYKFRMLWDMNLREFIHVVELRTRKQGHPSYRKVVQDLYRQVLEQLPWLEEFVRADMDDSPVIK
jgi:hypothetical protein